MGSLNVAFVMWRELFEAVLIVSIVHGFLLRQLGPRPARRLAATGVALGVGLSFLLGLVFQVLQTTLNAEALGHFQTAVLLVGAGFMTQMCLWMQKHGRRMRREIEATLAGAVAEVDRIPVLGVIAIAVAREGFEIVLYLYGMGVAGSWQATATGAALGAGLAALSGWCIVRGFRFLKPQLLFRLTGAFLLITAASLVVTATGRLLQAGVLSPLVDQVWDLSWLLDDRSAIGSVVASITGYQAAPALTTVLAYVLYWAFYLGAKRQATGERPMIPAVVATLVALLLLAAAAAPARAQTAAAPTSPPPERLKYNVSGYGDLQFAYHDYGPVESPTTGAPKDARANFDATRLAVEVEGFYLPYNVEFEVEVEFEHGGTGVALDPSRDEPGEFDRDVEKGGEVMLEEFFLRKHLSANASVAAGRIMVGVGLLPLYNRPTDYLAVGRDETETHLIPEAWNEMGFEGRLEIGDVRLLGQVVNGLDSSGFSSASWVASGHQQAFENVVATDLAGVVRADYLGIPGTTVGASGYYGGTSRNRPTPDMVKSPCDKSATARVAPCGYINAPVLITDVHAQVALEKLRGNGEVIWGRLQNADQITSHNASLNSTLDAPRDVVASQAFGYWGEVGYDIGPLVGASSESRLEPFARYDFYNTMYKVPAGSAKNPLYERRVATLGVSYTLGNALFAKFDVSRRSFASSALNVEDTAELGLGFIL